MGKKKVTDDLFKDDWFKDVETGKWVHIVITNIGVYKNGALIAMREHNEIKGGGK